MTTLFKINFLENWHLKLLSLIIAFLLWFYIANQKSINYTLPANIKYINIPETIIIPVKLPEKANIVLQGSRDIVSAASLTDLSIPIDLANLKAGNNTIKINYNNFTPPDGFKLIDITPSVIHIPAENKTYKKLSVIANTEGEPAQEYEIETVVIIPNIIKISGAESVVKNLFEIKTKPILIAGIQRSTLFTTALDTENIQGEVTTQINKISVDIKLRAKVK